MYVILYKIRCCHQKSDAFVQNVGTNNLVGFFYHLKLYTLLLICYYNICINKTNIIYVIKYICIHIIIVNDEFIA